MEELITAIGNDSVNRVVAMAGPYNFDTSAMSCGSALCINRTLTIEAEVPGAVVLNATGKWRVFKIESGGIATLIGLNITGGHPRGSEKDHGGGIYVGSGGRATLIDSNVYENKAPLGDGGGIYVGIGIKNSEPGHATLIDSNVYENSGKKAGGGLLIGGTAKLTNVNLYDNHAGWVWTSPFELSPGTARIKSYATSI